MATFYRSDGWVKTALGQAVAGASVYICLQPSDLSFLPPEPLANIFADPAGLSPITQPVLSDGFGHFDYYAASGTPYTEVIVYGGKIQQSYADQVPMGAILSSVLPPYTGIATQFLSGTGVFSTPPFPPTMTNLASGLVPVPPNDPTRFLNGAGTFTVPPGITSGTVTQVNTSTGLTGGPITGSGTISLANTAVFPGSYTSTNLTVNAQGQITAASNGGGGLVTLGPRSGNFYYGRVSNTSSGGMTGSGVADPTISGNGSSVIVAASATVPSYFQLHASAGPGTQAS